jgi:hypothetical protein
MTPFYVRLDIAWNQDCSADGVYRQSRGATRVAQECSSLRAMSLLPIQWLQAVQLSTLSYQVIHSLHAAWGTQVTSKLLGQFEEVDAIARYATFLCGFLCGLEERKAGEEDLCARVLKLVHEFRKLVCGIGWRLDAAESMGSPCQWKCIKLLKSAIGSWQVSAAPRTVFTEKTAMTLSHSDPAFGCHPSSFARPRAR